MAAGRRGSIQSMTGYGRSSRQTKDYSVSVEMRATNHRYLEIDQRLPNGFVGMDVRIGDLIRTQIHRGRVDVFISIRSDKWNRRCVSFDEPLLHGYHDALLAIKNQFGLTGRVTLDQLLALPQALRVMEQRVPLDQCWKPIRETLLDALRQLVASRCREGTKLAADVRRLAGSIETHVRAVRRRLPQAMAEQRKRLRHRIRELLGANENGSLSQLREVAALVRDTDVHEEIVRLNSHIAHIKHTLSAGKPVGKQLDFIAQELTREANTLGAKVNDSVAIRRVVEIKGCIEKIREQAQNLE